MSSKLPGVDAKAVSIITLGVRDLEKEVAFYEAMGWEHSPDSDDACHFMLSTNVVLGLLNHKKLAEEMLMEVTEIPQYTGLLLSMNGASAEEVDAIYERALAAGATSQQKPIWKDWAGNPGYSGFILDPEGYCWELAYAPHLRIGEDNRLLPTTQAEAKEKL
ncbi:MAG: hypothetical protein Q4B73_06260 [Lachnospiraceae bacterium]|nr:hypothetical protein [Lachnospiraceae bacterium]